MNKETGVSGNLLDLVDLRVPGGYSKHPIKTKTDDDGNLQFATMPFVSGHTKGTTTMKATGAGCWPSVKFDWGK